MSEEKRFVFPENGRNAAYKAQLEEIHRKGICPFCPGHLQDGKKDEILRTADYWVVAKTIPPYPGSVASIVIISIQHITHSWQLTAAARIEFFDLIDWVVLEHNLEHYTVVMRNGGPESGATVAHLHYHVVSAGSENILTRIG